MLNYFLHNDIFENILVITVFINLIFFCVKRFIKFKKERKESKETNKIIDDDKIILIKSKIMLIWSILIVVFFVFFLFRIFRYIFYLIAPTIFLIKIIWDTYTKKQSHESNDSVIIISYIYIIFFRSYASDVYYSSFASIPHTYKEVLLIFFLIIKIILFIFLILLNIKSLIENIFTIWPNFLKVKEWEKKEVKIIDYNFPLYKKNMNNASLIIDTIICSILCPLALSLNIIKIIAFKLAKYTLLFINYMRNFLAYFIENGNLIIRKITNISFIISFVIVYIIIALNNSLFSATVSNIYNFIASVILIPLIYDFIKSRN